MNWVFDEYFVPPDMHERVFALFGVACGDVESSAGKKLDTVVQLALDELVDVDVSECGHWACPACGRVVYWPVTRGPFPSLLAEPTSAMAHTRQYFSGGGWAYQRVLVRADLARAMREAGIRSATYWPVADTGSCMPAD